MSRADVDNDLLQWAYRQLKLSCVEKHDHTIDCYTGDERALKPARNCHASIGRRERLSHRAH